ncbi:hypothetical protein MESS2_730060 [Mesorhizobium metallidurans STM 2683]|uniref:Uncharacterized protein n=1 Tax=Mesorhizobium metallidurans STM 2683 TaxID=1297569 RepID=M5ET71_9HYPH|nr:hypothetical protein MESS2_730060 [Mesorhizobium metallidurans STM 2683]
MTRPSERLERVTRRLSVARLNGSNARQKRGAGREWLVTCIAVARHLHHSAQVRGWGLASCKTTRAVFGAVSAMSSRAKSNYDRY